MASDNQPDQDPLIDDRILDDDDNDDDHALDEVVVDGSYDDMFDTHEHVGGKNIRMTDPRPKSPSTTPPDSPIESGLTNDPPQEKKAKDWEHGTASCQNTQSKLWNNSLRNQRIHRD